MKTVHITDAEVASEPSHHPVAKRARHNNSSSNSTTHRTALVQADEKEGEVGYPCRFLLSEQKDTLLPISARTMWQRSTQYSTYARYYDEYRTSQEAISLSGKGSGAGAGGSAHDPFSQAVAQLHISVLPAALPCREEEQRKVFQFLKTAMTEGGRKRPLYISGMPGTVI